MLAVLAIPGCEPTFAAEVSIIGGDRNAILQLTGDVGPIDFGFRIHSQFSDTSSGDDWTIEETFMGPVVEFKLGKVGPVTPYLSAAALWHVESKNNVYTPLGAGLSLGLTDALSARVEVQYCDRGKLYRDDEWFVGGGLTWEFK